MSVGDGLVYEMFKVARYGVLRQLQLDLMAFDFPTLDGVVEAG